ncbi:MAG: MEthanogen/methylotroph, DcmR Sensory domain, partial [Acidimicrobiaceae bacterium]|nr:MEthanogen/methylotroph, DcmR Sensory domain [Acidimicrobiaceae bacterium]
MRPSTLDALATALEVSVDYLLGRAPSPDVRPLLKHRLLRYATADEFHAVVTPFFAEGMARGEPILVVATPSKCRALRR